MTNFFRKRKLRAFFVAVFLVVLCCIFFQNPKNTFADAYKGIHYYSVNGTYTSANITDGFFGGSIYDKNLYFTPAMSYGGQYLFQGTDLKYYYTNSDPTKGDVAIYPATNDLPLLQRYFRAGQTAVDANTEIAKLGATGAGATVENDGQCLRGPTQAGSYIDVGNCLAQLLYWILYGISFVVNWIVNLFDIVFKYTVANISDTVTKMDIINAGWTAVRDIANICFIFILLYLAIATILQLDEHGVKHSLSRLIIAAVLINFSLFFTKAIIDVPNILSIQIYNKVVGDQKGGVGSAFFTILKPEKFTKGAAGQLGTNQNGLVGNNGNINNPATNSQTSTDAQNFAKTAPFTTFIMMIILYVILCAVFLAATIIFIKRFVMLIFLMIFSPLAFAGMAIPIHSLQSAAKEKFWNSLIKEAFYAPIFMMCIYIALVTGQNAYNKLTFDNTSATFSGTIFIFVVVCAMLVASLIIAEEMGVKGASGAMGMYKGVTGAALGASKWTGAWVGRNTVGRAAWTLVNKEGGAFAASDRLANAAAGLGTGNALTRFAKKYAARAVLGVGDRAGAGFKADVSKEAERFKRAIEEAHDDPKKIAEILTMAGKKGLGTKTLQAGDELFHGLSAEMKTNVKLFMNDMVKNPTKYDKTAVEATGYNRYFKDHGHGRMTPEEAVESEKMEQEKLLSFHKEQLRDSMFQRDSHRALTSTAKTDMTEAAKVYSVLGDKQKTDFISSLTRDEQIALAKNGDFQKKVLEANLKTFDLIERAGKGAAVTKEMKEKLSDIAYGSLSRYDSSQALKAAAKDDKLSHAQYAAIEHEFEKATGISVGTRPVLDVIKEYESSIEGRNDETFKGADRNLKRFLSANEEYTKMVQRIVSAGGVVARG